jgi:5-formyltetrahydrofolate cyclo-ligase
MTDLSVLRTQLRKTRRSLGAGERLRAAEAALAGLQEMPEYRASHTVAVYAGNDGELCPLPITGSADRAGKRVYLPVLHPSAEGRLQFARWRPGEPLQTNRFGIPEPVTEPDRLIDPSYLDLVVVPVLGFDRQGHRLGMGGGYYDRTFAFRNTPDAEPRPLLVGLAHAKQQVASIERQPWDVMLDAVITNRQVLRFNDR